MTLIDLLQLVKIIYKKDLESLYACQRHLLLETIQLKKLENLLVSTKILVTGYTTHYEDFFYIHLKYPLISPFIIHMYNI